MRNKKPVSNIIFVFLFICMFLSVSEAKERSNAKEFLVCPGFVLKSVTKAESGARVSAETYKGNIFKFYEKKLKSLGWVKVADLNPEDFTLCGGDYGGTYERKEVRFKLHICGFENKGIKKTISFFFFDLTPEQVLGKYLPDK